MNKTNFIFIILCAFLLWGCSSKLEEFKPINQVKPTKTSTVKKAS